MEGNIVIALHGFNFHFHRNKICLDFLIIVYVTTFNFKSSLSLISFSNFCIKSLFDIKSEKILINTYRLNTK